MKQPFRFRLPTTGFNFDRRLNRYLFRLGTPFNQRAIYRVLVLSSLGLVSLQRSAPVLTVTKSTTIDSLGACQGISYVDGRLYLYGDREVGMIREYTLRDDSLSFTRREYRLTLDGKDVINHPTGIAKHGAEPTFIGNSVRPGDASPAGTKWRAVIYSVDWEGLRRTGTLDGNLLNTIEDDTCIQGTRPEYVRYRNKWYVATADYGDRRNEVRLYDPAVLRTAKKTSDRGVLVKKFTCGPWVQNLHWVPEKNVLVLIQNQIEGRRWRFTFLDFVKSVESGKQVVINTIDVDNADELEGFTLLQQPTRGLAVTSSRLNNVHFIDLNW